MSPSAACAFAGGVLVLVIVLVWRVLPARLLPFRTHSFVFPNQSAGSQQRPLRVAVVLGSGGHTAEMIPLLRALGVVDSDSPYRHVEFVVADTDSTSRGRVEAAQVVPPGCRFVTIPRAREVGQAWTSSLVTTARALRFTFSYMFGAEHPDLLLVNGPGTCVPLCVWAALLRVLPCRRPTAVVYVESVCRVTSLSLAGKILYCIADVFLVQWKQLQQRYRYSEWLGLLT